MLFGIEFRTEMPASRWVYLPPWSGAWRIEKLIQLKYYVVLKRQVTINLGLSAAKNMHHIKKKLEIKVIQFGTTFI